MRVRIRDRRGALSGDDKGRLGHGHALRLRGRALLDVHAFHTVPIHQERHAHRTRQKQQRNAVYVACGSAMLVFIAFIAAYMQFLRNTSIAAIQPVFWLESLTLWSFGISWVTKGEFVLKDRP
jgi:hypothetical protein